MGENTVHCKGRQIPKFAWIIPKNNLYRCLLLWREYESRDLESEGLAGGINDQDGVADVEVAQTPKHRRVSTRAIQVSSNHSTAPFAWTWPPTVPADIVPGMLPRRFHRAIWSNSHRLDSGIDTDGRNEQAREWCRSRTWRGRSRSERQSSYTEGQSHHRDEHSPEQPRRAVRDLLLAERPEANEHPSTYSSQSEHPQQPGS